MLLSEVLIEILSAELERLEGVAVDPAIILLNDYVLNAGSLCGAENSIP